MISPQRKLIALHIRPGVRTSLPDHVALELYLAELNGKLLGASPTEVQSMRGPQLRGGTKPISPNCRHSSYEQAIKDDLSCLKAFPSSYIGLNWQHLLNLQHLIVQNTTPSSIGWVMHTVLWTKRI